MKRAFLWLIIISIIAIFSLSGCKEETKTKELEAKMAKLEEEIEAVKETEEEVPGESEGEGEEEGGKLDFLENPYIISVCEIDALFSRDLSVNVVGSLFDVIAFLSMRVSSG